MKRIPVGGNRRGVPDAYALVDDADFESLSLYRWHLHEGYAARNMRLSDGRKRVVLMHRQVLGFVPGDGRQADHRNRNRLDNQRENLRPATHAQQRQNVTTYARSGVRGVYPSKGRWAARYARKHLGTFDTIEEARVVVEAYRAQHVPYSEEASAA